MVEAEQHSEFLRHEISAIVLLVRRAPAGNWTFDLDLKATVELPDGRLVMLNGHVATKASGYVGHKRRSPNVAKALTDEPAKGEQG